MNGMGTSASFINLVDFVLTPDESIGFVIHMNGIRRVNMSSLHVTMFAGSFAGFLDGPATSAQFDSLSGGAVSPDGTYMLLCDRSSHRIRKITLTVPYTVSTLVGDGVAGSVDGPGILARLTSPKSIDISSNGLKAVVGSMNKVRIIDLQSLMVTTLMNTSSMVMDVVIRSDSRCD